MADCVVNVADKEYQTGFYSKRLAGQIHKGHNAVSANASIPTKYQTIISENSDKKGFLSKAKRFEKFHVTDTPSPGEYSNHEKFEKLSPSFSKKGTGGLASKSKRGSLLTMSNAPGPGIYSLPSLLKSRRDFGRGPQGVFATPVAEHVQKSNGIPAPNNYNVLRVNLGKTNNVTANSVFKSKTQRDILKPAEQSNVPAPGQYTINDELNYSSVKVPFSSFKSQSKREILAKPNKFPGPGHYKPNEAVEPANRLIFPRKHYLCISAPAMPLPQTPPLPGPGSYEMVNYEGPVKHFMSGSSFVSTTGRWTGSVVPGTADLPGPAHYRPVPLGKQSFIYNAAGRWI